MVSNVMKLVNIKFAAIAIPKDGGIANAVDILSDRAKVTATFDTARKWVAEAIAAVKTAPDNPHGDDDELIAGAILAELDRKYPRGHG